MNVSFVWTPVIVAVTAFIWILLRSESALVRISVCFKYMVVGGLLASVAAFFITVILTLSLNLSQLPLMFIYLLPVIFAFGEIAGIIKYFSRK